MAAFFQEPRERKNDEKPPLLPVLPLETLGNEGKDWSVLDPDDRSFSEGIGGRVGRGANWLEASEALEAG